MPCASAASKLSAVSQRWAGTPRLEASLTQSMRGLPRSSRSWPRGRACRRRCGQFDPQDAIDVVGEDDDRHSSCSRAIVHKP